MPIRHAPPLWACSPAPEGPALRRFRPDLYRHGRYGYNKFTGQVVRVVGLPGSARRLEGDGLIRPTSQKADRDVEPVDRTAK
jgi:hypothetical protein